VIHGKVKFVFREPSGPPWARAHQTVAQEYESVEEMISDVEMIDTFGDPHSWVEDQRGNRLDVRANGLWGKTQDDVFEIKQF